MPFDLFPDQTEFVEGIFEGTERNDANVLGVAVTGCGKTVMGATLADLWGFRGHDTWIFAHREALIDGWSDSLKFIGADHGVIKPGRPLTNHRLQVCSVGTVAARIKELGPRLARLGRMLDDECHHTPSATRQQIRKMARRALRVGLTATPYRTDGTGLGNIYNWVVRGRSMRELIDLGRISDYAIFEPKIRLDFTGMQSRAGDITEAENERVFDRGAVTQTAIAAYREKLNGQPCLIFCSSVRHAEKVAQAFRDAGYRAASIDGKSKNQKELIAALGTGELQILTNFAIVEEGTDIPKCAGAIFLRKTLSTILYQQWVGRTLRLFLGKIRAIIIDIARNCEFHGMPDADRQWTLAGGIKGLERNVPPTRRCSGCFCRSEDGLVLCPECNRPFGAISRLVRRAPLVPVAAVPADSALPHLTDTQILGMDLDALRKLARTRAELSRIAQVRGYQPAWTDQILQARGQGRFSGRRS